MGSYGEPVLDKMNHLIGYKINKTDYASIETYYNENNLLCNKVSIREFLHLQLDPMAQVIQLNQLEFSN
jgi:hypothetical protein